MNQKITIEYPIGDAISYFRVKNGFTQEAITAELQLKGIDISRSTYSQMERGTYHVPFDLLLTLKDIYHIDITDFFDVNAP